MAGKKPKRMTDAQRAEVRRLHMEGWSEKAIAEHVDFTRESVRRIVDPVWAERRKAAINQNRNNRKRGDQTPNHEVYRAQRRFSLEELRQRIEEIPPDTRDLTGKLLGDPIPNDPRRPWLGGSA